MKKCFFFFAFISSLPLAYSQVPKKIIVEHFTNTKCSVCAARNPGFYTNYSANPGVLHLAVHPSSPYSACVLSMHNPGENDARTNYYGVYGGTPRLVIQGAVISSTADYGSAAIFAPFTGQTSPASIKIVQSKYGNDSIRARIIIKTEASHSLGSLSLFVALAEDTLNYTGSNGEPIHYDVFRKSLTGATGVNITLPSVVGDSVVYTMSSTVNGAWNFSRIYTLAILQETLSKSVIQCQSVSARSNNIITGLSNLKRETLNSVVFVTEEGIIVRQDKFSENTSVTLYDISGRLLLEKVLTRNVETLSLPSLPPGIYLYNLKSEKSTIKRGKLFIQ